MPLSLAIPMMGTRPCMGHSRVMRSRSGNRASGGGARVIIGSAGGRRRVGRGRSGRVREVVSHQRRGTRPPMVGRQRRDRRGRRSGRRRESAGGGSSGCGRDRSCLLGLCGRSHRRGRGWRVSGGHKVSLLLLKLASLSFSSVAFFLSLAVLMLRCGCGRRHRCSRGGSSRRRRRGRASTTWFSEGGDGP